LLLLDDEHLAADGACRHCRPFYNLFYSLQALPHALNRTSWGVDLGVVSVQVEERSEVSQNGAAATGLAVDHGKAKIRAVEAVDAVKG
jgi:hypothetical protein